jgi:hypothetical protein
MILCDICQGEVLPGNDVVTLETIVYHLDNPSDVIGTANWTVDAGPPIEILGLEFVTKMNRNVSRHLEPVVSTSGEKILCPGDASRMRFIGFDASIDKRFPELPLSQNRVTIYKLGYILLKLCVRGEKSLSVRFQG